MSFALVLVATVLLVLGLLVGDGLTLIYLSILLSVLAGVVLFIAVRASKPVHANQTGPAPLVPSTNADDEFAATEQQPAYATAGAPPASAEYTTVAPATPPPPVSAPLPPPPPMPTPSQAATDSGEWLAADQEWGDSEWAEGDDLDFPIAEYDDLTEDEIMPLLPQLYPEEISVVEERELAGKARPAILTMLATLPREDAAPPATAPAPAPAPAPVAPVSPVAPAPVAEWEAEEEPELEAVGDEQVFPIDDYDRLAVSEIVSLLSELDADELTEVKAYEESNRNRRTIVANIDRRLGITPSASAAVTRARELTAPREPPAPRVTPAARKAARAKAAAARPSAAGTRKATAAPRKAAPARAAVSRTPVGPYGRGSAAPGPGGRPPQGFPIKGNATSMLYHLPGGGAYARTNANVYFATEAAAQKAGFSPAGTRKAAAPAKKAAPKGRS